jgi:methionine synthase II (cobalamin-independent)
MIRAHADVVGSLLRPPWLVEAQRTAADGALTAAEFKTIEDRAVDEAVALQEAAGLAMVTDGEMRRLSFQSQMTAAVDGFGECGLDAFLWGQWYGDAAIGDWRRERPPAIGVVSRLTRRRHLCAEEFSYLRARATRRPKISLTSPSLWANFWSAERSTSVYPTLESFLADVVDILREEVAELVRLGATYIQLDAPHYPLLLDPRTRAFYEGQGWTLERWLEHGIDLDNAVIGAAPNVTFGLHLCRGNQGSRWLVAGGYDLIAKPIFRRTRAQRLLLEYDDARSGGFEPLREAPDDKIVVLGLVTTKSPRLETREELTARVNDAGRFVAMERLALSPQCGFASSVIGNRLSADDQQRKLRLVVETARDIWGCD